MKLFFLPAKPIPCEFKVKGQFTRGLVEGLELMSGKRMMRIYLSYRSMHRVAQLAQQKIAFVRGAPQITNKYHLREIWNMAFPHPKVGQGYEYVSRLIRFGPKACKNRRSTGWSFYGVYDKLIPSGLTQPGRDLPLIHFMAKYARRDRSVNHIRLPPSSKSSSPNLGPLDTF